MSSQNLLDHFTLFRLREYRIKCVFKQLNCHIETTFLGPLIFPSIHLMGLIRQRANRARQSSNSVTQELEKCFTGGTSPKISWQFRQKQNIAIIKANEHVGLPSDSGETQVVEVEGCG